MPPVVREKHLIQGTWLLRVVLLGATAASAGGAPVARGALRVTFWGALAMGLTAAVGSLFGVAA
jgi:VIT1/CCC1 family predicted Fe2+/Mn2+ transporter